MRSSIFTIILFCFLASLYAQHREQMVKVAVVPNHSDWKYGLGENVIFDIIVTKNGMPLKNVEIQYDISYDMMAPIKKETSTLREGTMTVNVGTTKTAGFLRCRVRANYGGTVYEGRATAAFTPENIQPVATLPDDFIKFWERAKQENSKIPMEAKLRLLPERCTEKVNVYEWNVQNYRLGSRMYGILCVPTAPGKYPALLRVPGAGVRPYNGAIAEAEKGMITLEIGIHGIPVTMESLAYTSLGQGALYNYQHQNWDNRDEVYYKRVYIGCVRAIDYIFAMKTFDGENVIVQGGSQGGALSIVTAALDSRVKGVVSFFPALSDLNGFAKGRAGGWPHLFRYSTDTPEIIKKKMETTSYYDVVNFARMIKVPVFYYLGYNDMVCPPTSTYAVYNIITAPKELVIMEEAEHYAYPEHWIQAMNWIYSMFGIKH